MTELGMTPASRSRVAADPRMQVPEIDLHHDLRGGPGAEFERSRSSMAIAERVSRHAARATARPAPPPVPRLPTCPSHLNPAAAAEWRRIAKALQQAGVLTTFDRAALAAYCQAYGRWVEAEERLRETPTLFKTPSGYVQQSPWLGIVNKQLELMGRYMVELGHDARPRGAG